MEKKAAKKTEKKKVPKKPYRSLKKIPDTFVCLKTVKDEVYGTCSWRLTKNEVFEKDSSGYYCKETGNGIGFDGSKKDIKLLNLLFKEGILGKIKKEKKK